MVVKKGKRLRSGFTTGTAAAAATKAALVFLLSKQQPENVSILLLTGDRITIKVHSCTLIDSHTAVCTVIKDAGDDPDITHKAEIGARVTWKDLEGQPVVAIDGGVGVGRVTKPGLEIPPGEPAINLGPREMIRIAVLEALDNQNRQGRVDTVIFVPKGELLAKKTLNFRLGIVNGISILGTTGIVRPLSHDAYIATIGSALSVARATGLNQVVLTTGRRSERFAQGVWKQLPEEGFVQIGDFFKHSMGIVAAKGFKEAIIAVFFGKAVKMAQGIGHTHARSARLTLELLARWSLDLTGDEQLRERIEKANTARHAFDLLKEDYPAVIEKVGNEVVRWGQKFCSGKVKVGAVIFGFDGEIRYTSKTINHQV